MTTLIEHPLATLAASSFLLVLISAGAAVSLPFLNQDILFTLILASIGVIVTFTIGCAYYAEGFLLGERGNA